MQEIRVAVLGCGAAGRGHATTMAVLPGVKVVAVSDVDKTKGEKLAGEIDTRYFADYHELIETLRNEIDAVSIALPHKYHAAAALAAIAAGKHVLLEKPMCLTIDECNQVIGAARQAGVRLMVGFTHRFASDLMMARRLIDAGDLGQLTLAVDYMSFGGDGAIGNWNWDKELSGGGMYIYNSVHGADRLRWLLGAEVTEAYAMLNLTHEGDTEDNGVACLRFESGTICSMVTNHRTYQVPGKCDLDIYGLKGSIRIRTKQAITFMSQRTTWTLTSQKDNHWAAEMQEFIDTIREDREPCITGHDGKMALAMILAIYKSAELGRPVRMAEIL